MTDVILKFMCNLTLCIIAFGKIVSRYMNLFCFNH